ncbi:hypothetical protein HMPREF3038_02978 [Akkermansia sp. KLE1797]|nr:hypothetical protein HMPREF3038_02978 [Akkermansia sp. KLE1797]KXU52728.1 hypothetical protein HMPREF3039_03078 [Akkermansia sp. KLE1798]KZA03988.1 hypothetical protein HMPREF1326_02182 [Akkermansia sp. KLE1605]
MSLPVTGREDIYATPQDHSKSPSSFSGTPQRILTDLHEPGVPISYPQASSGKSAGLP